MMKLLHAISPAIPNLRFRTQQTEQQTKGNIRPDMVGYHESETRVFVENKFWAGLTDNQPISYLNQLAVCKKPTILLVVVPDDREQIMLRELSCRLNIAATSWETHSGSIVHSIKTEIGPILALTSWTRLLSALELEVVNDPSTRSDLHQLQALCEAADRDAFVPMSSAQVSDQRMPAFILQLNTIVQDSVNLAVTKGVLNINGLNPQADWKRTGRYARFSNEKGVGIWLGIHFGLWKTYGRTPFWLVFSKSQTFGRAREVRILLESWAAEKGVFTKFEDDELVVAIDFAFGEEKDLVVRSVVDRLNEIAVVLRVLPQKIE
jgi:hypothetical protein